MSRFESSIGLGSSGHGVMTTPATVSPPARAASTVSSVWLIVPRPGRAAITTGRREVERQVAHEVAGRERHHQAADALADQQRRRRRARLLARGLHQLAPARS